MLIWGSWGCRACAWPLKFWPLQYWRSKNKFGMYYGGFYWVHTVVVLRWGQCANFYKIRPTLIGNQNMSLWALWQTDQNNIWPFSHLSAQKMNPYARMGIFYGKLTNFQLLHVQPIVFLPCRQVWVSRCWPFWGQQPLKDLRVSHQSKQLLPLIRTSEDFKGRSSTERPRWRTTTSSVSLCLSKACRCRRSSWWWYRATAEEASVRKALETRERPLLQGGLTTTFLSVAFSSFLVEPEDWGEWRRPRRSFCEWHSHEPYSTRYRKCAIVHSKVWPTKYIWCKNVTYNVIHKM